MIKYSFSRSSSQNFPDKHFKMNMIDLLFSVLAGIEWGPVKRWVRELIPVKSASRLLNLLLYYAGNFSSLRRLLKSTTGTFKNFYGKNSSEPIKNPNIQKNAPRTFARLSPIHNFQPLLLSRLASYQTN